MTTEITTVKELLDLPAGTIVRSSAGTIACRHPEGMGTVFGDERTFEWTRLALPAVVIYPTPAPSNRHQVGEAAETAADTVHHVELVAEDGYLVKHFACTATAGALCRLRPSDDREEWTYADSDLIDSGRCWAVEHVDVVGIEDALIGVPEGTFARVPVSVRYSWETDGGVEVTPVPPHPTLPLRAALAVLNEEPGE